MTGHRWQGTDVDTIETRYRQHRYVEDVNEVWQGTDVDTISTRYCQHRDVDDIEKTSWTGHTSVVDGPSPQLTENLLKN